MFLRLLLCPLCSMLLIACGVSSEETPQAGAKATGAPENLTTSPPSIPSSPSASTSTADSADDARTVSDGVRLDLLESTDLSTSATLTNLNDLPIATTVRVQVLGIADATPLADMTGDVQLDGRATSTIFLTPSDPRGDPAITCPSGNCSYIFTATALKVDDGGDHPASTERTCTPEVCRLLG